VHIIILSEDLVKVHSSEVLTVSNGLKLAPRSHLSPAPGGITVITSNIGQESAILFSLEQNLADEVGNCKTNFKVKLKEDMIDAPII